MRKPTLLIFTNALILVVIFLLLAQSLFAVQRLAQAREVSGQVTVLRAENTDFEPLTKDATLGLGDTVRTGANGRIEMAFADRTRWKIGPNSQVGLLKASANAQNRSQMSRLRLENGELWLRNPEVRNVQREFEIETPTALARTQGSVLRVEAGAAKTTVEVFKGMAQLKTADRVAVVTAGEIATASAENIEVQKSPLARLSNPQYIAAEFLRPALEVQLAVNPGAEKPFVVVRGQSEAGGKVEINGKSVPVLNNGLFLRRFDLKAGENRFQIEATDAHGAQNSTCRAVRFDAQTKKATETACS